MKKVVWVFSLSVMLLTQIITPFAYATGDATPVGEVVVEKLVTPVEDTVSEDEVTTWDAVAEQTEGKVQQGTDFSVGGDDKSSLVEQKWISWDNAQIGSWNSKDNHDVAPVEAQSWTTVEANSWDITKLSWNNENLKEEQTEGKTENWSGGESKTWLFESIKDFLWLWETKEEEKNVFDYETQVITWEAEYDDVKVEVYADTWLFYSWTELVIKAVTGDEYEWVKEVLSWQLENIIEEQTLVAFDISFIYSWEEVQPLTWTVQVSFNYENNEDLKAAEESEEQEVKVYHLNDKDEEWEKIEEITWVKLEEVVVNEEKSEEENLLVVEAENFSIYTIVKQVKEEQVINFEYWEISITNAWNPNQKITIMDRNLWATSNNIEDVWSYWYHYQWWNNYGFDSSKNSSEIIRWGALIDVSSVEEYSWNVFVWKSSWMKSFRILWWNWWQWPCPEWWHVPTRSEWNNLYQYYNNTYSSWVDGFLSYFKLPFAGYRYFQDGYVYEKGRAWRYWTTSILSMSTYPYYIKLWIWEVGLDKYTYNGYGSSVRCFKNIPTNTSILYTPPSISISCNFLIENLFLILISIK